MKRDYANGNGLLTSIFSGKNITSKDISAIQAMNESMKNGSTVAQAWTDNMKGCTVAAKEQVKQCLINKGSLSDLSSSMEGMTLSAKAGQVALKGLAIAGNMLATMLITKGIELSINLIDDIVHKTEHAMDSLEESSQTFNQTAEDIKSLNEELQTTNIRITELEKLKDAGKISIAEEDELENLKEQNKELERNLVLKKQKRIEDAKDVLTDLNKANLDVDSKYDTVSIHGDAVSKKVSRVNEAKMAQKEYNDLLSQRNKLEKEESRLLEKNGDKESSELTDVRVKLREIDSSLANTDEYIGKLYDKNVQKKISEISVYESLIDQGVKLDKTQETEYKNLSSLRDVYFMHCYMVQQTEEAYKALNVEQQKSVLLDRLKKRGLSTTQSKAVVDNLNEKDIENLFNSNFDFKIPDVNKYDGDMFCL